MILAALVLAGIGSRVVQARAADIRPYLQQTLKYHAPNKTKDTEALAAVRKPAAWPQQGPQQSIDFSFQG